MRIRARPVAGGGFSSGLLSASTFSSPIARRPRSNKHIVLSAEGDMVTWGPSPCYGELVRWVGRKPPPLNADAAELTSRSPTHV